MWWNMRRDLLRVSLDITLEHMILYAANIVRVCRRDRKNKPLYIFRSQFALWCEHVLLDWTRFVRRNEGVRLVGQ